MFWGSRGLGLHAFTATVSWLWYSVIAYMDSGGKAKRERAIDSERKRWIEKDRER